MKFLTHGTLLLFACCQIVLHGFVFDTVNGQHDPDECSPTDTPFTIKYSYGNLYSAVLSITVRCSCKGRISYFRNFHGVTGKYINFYGPKNKKTGDDGEFISGKTKYERDGWKVDPGVYSSIDGNLAWRLRGQKGEFTNNDHIVRDTTTNFEFTCEQEADECVAKWTDIGLTSVYKNGVFVENINFGKHPSVQVQKDILPQLSFADVTTAPTSELLDQVTSTGTPQPGSCGDPHFTTWNGKRFDFHGECDLVLATSRSFGNGKGLDIHIRTTMVSRATHPYSYISEAAIRVGKQVLSIDRNGYWLDGIPRTFDEKDSVTLSGYTVEVSDSLTKKGKFMKKFTVDLRDDGHLVTIKAAKSHIDVALDRDGTMGNHFDDLVGLLGRYNDGALVDRNGHLMTGAHENDLGQMWQVREWEDMLFPNATGPQHPTKCSLPSATQTSRHLRSIADTETLSEAQFACGHVWNVADRDNCIFDVLATGDNDMADFYDEF